VQMLVVMIVIETQTMFGTGVCDRTDYVVRASVYQIIVTECAEKFLSLRVGLTQD